MESDGRWVLSADGETFCETTYASREKAISAGIRMAEEVVGPDADEISQRIDSDSIFYDLVSNGDGGPFCVPPSFFVGVAVEFAPQVDEDNVLDQISANAYDFGGEWAQDWIDDIDGISKPERERLRDMLQDALDRWLGETRNRPGFFMACQVEHVDGDGTVLPRWA